MLQTAFSAIGKNRATWRASWSRWITKHLDDVSGEVFIDLAITRHWLRDARGGIAEPIVLPARPNQHTAHAANGFDEIDAFHEIFDLAMPKISPLAISS